MEEKERDIEIETPQEAAQEEGLTPEGGAAEGAPDEKYLRLYAEFENYKKRVNRDKEDLVKFANEEIVFELLPSLDNLEIALKHAREASSSEGLFQGVEATLRELRRTLEKFGLKAIEAEGKDFDPAYHHAISQAERTDIEENMVVEDFRRGYIYKDKVLRPSLVVVSARPKGAAGENGGESAEE